MSTRTLLPSSLQSSDSLADLIRTEEFADSKTKREKWRSDWDLRKKRRGKIVKRRSRYTNGRGQTAVLSAACANGQHGDRCHKLNCSCSCHHPGARSDA